MLGRTIKWAKMILYLIWFSSFCVSFPHRLLGGMSLMSCLFFFSQYLKQEKCLFLPLFSTGSQSQCRHCTMVQKCYTSHTQRCVSKVLSRPWPTLHISTISRYLVNIYDKYWMFFCEMQCSHHKSTQEVDSNDHLLIRKILIQILKEGSPLSVSIC